MARVLLAVLVVLGSWALDAGLGGRALALDGPLAAECEWPSALFGVCSSVLVHPRVVLASGHCHGGGVRRQMVFGERHDVARVEVGAECHTVPGVDLTYCVLDDAVDVPFVPPAMGCEVASSGPAVMAGYGDSLVDGTIDPWGAKRVAPATVAWTSGSAFAIDGVLARTMDSGSPTFVPAADGTWRVLGVIVDSNFRDRATGVVIAPQVAAIEAATGIDITPCHDADGTWSPGPDCRDFPVVTSTGSGEWPACTYETSRRYADSCGAPYAIDPPDAGPHAPGDAGASDAGAGAPDGGAPVDDGGLGLVSALEAEPTRGVHRPTALVGTCSATRGASSPAGLMVALLVAAAVARSRRALERRARERAVPRRACRSR